MKNWHVSDLENRMYIPIEGGKKIAMPRYLKNLIYDENERNIVKTAQVQRIGEELERSRSLATYEKDQSDLQSAVLASTHKMLHNSKRDSKL